MRFAIRHVTSDRTLRQCEYEGEPSCRQRARAAVSCWHRVQKLLGKAVRGRQSLYCECGRGWVNVGGGNVPENEAWRFEEGGGLVWYKSEREVICRRREKQSMPCV
jgi:hypothetical protein